MNQTQRVLAARFLAAFPDSTAAQTARVVGCNVSERKALELEFETLKAEILASGR